MKSIGLLVVLFLAGTQGAKVCISKSECEPGECCQRLSEFMIVSKRDVVGAPTTLPKTFPPFFKTGTCQPYTLEGRYCDPFGSINGYCSCEPGTSCGRARIPTIPPPSPLPTTTTTTPPTAYPSTTSAAKLVRKGRTIGPPPPGYANEFTCV